MVEFAVERYDAVVFDMDGVITDTAGVHAAAWKRMFDAFLAAWSAQTGVAQRPFDDDDYLRDVDGKNRDDGVVSFLASRGIELPLGSIDDPPERATACGLANRKNDELQRVLATQGARVFPSSVAFVRELQRRGIGTAIVSASRNCHRVLEAAGIGDLFAVRVDGLECERLSLPGKPAPALFLEAARRLATPPDRAVVVEDAIAGVQAGRDGRFGLVIGVDRTGNGADLRSNGADIVVGDLAEISVGDSDGPSRARDDRTLPFVDPEPGWRLDRSGFNEDRLRVNAALFSMADGRIGTSGALLPSYPGSERWVLACGVYAGSGPDTHLLFGPVAFHLPFDIAKHSPLRRVLDLRSGLLYEQVTTTRGALESVRFASLARPGTIAFRARCPDDVVASPALLMPPEAAECGEGILDGATWMTVSDGEGGITAAAVDTNTPIGARLIERIAGYCADPSRVPEPREAVSLLREATEIGFEALVSEQRRAWTSRWEEADIVVSGDDEMQEATRLALFHLMASVPTEGEAAVGARGLSGPSYRGHVFWDTDTFVLPFLAATHPASARAILEYRIRRLPAAIENARSSGYEGARYPWESAQSGRDVTPTSARDRTGAVVPIRTGQLEEHIVAQVAWAACCYVDWTGDADFAAGPGRRLLVETARYWASRVRVDRDGAHIYGVIGPDEYHEPVDDNAFTNVMARWNLNRAADVVTETQPDARTVSEAARWRTIANALVDGYDSSTGIYEQFAGFDGLEPLVISEIAPRRPIAADLLLGAERVRGAQVLKQADVLMLHHLVPDAVVPGSLEANLGFYEPRTAHGSSLSPAIHASLFARAGEHGRALDALRIASRIDLGDLTDTTAGGLHLATMGGLWQAFAYGFAGLRPRDDRLEIDPHLPPEWNALEMRVRFRGSRVRIRMRHGGVTLDADAPTAVTVGATRCSVGPRGVDLRRTGATWEVTT